ncbi:MAG: hypothetical protein LJE64_14720 [Desulfofustis sp.]|nr:hypothetical protein [Desulfofustis sp.]
MDDNKKILPQKPTGSRLKLSIKTVMALLCLWLITGGPCGPLQSIWWFAPEPVAAAPGDTQDTGSAGTAVNDTPSEQAIADFASQFDKDGDGEVDEPEAETEESAEQDDAASQDDVNDDDKNADREDDRDGEDRLDHDAESGDIGDNREDIDGEASPDYRMSGFDRYPVDKGLRRLGEYSGLTPLIEREEQLLIEN